MRLIKPYYTILKIPSNIDILEHIGRTCYKSEDKIGVGTAEKFVKMIFNRGHWSVLEHLSATVRFICDRGVSHELVRHRIASYSQESTRYCNYKGGVTFIIPPWTLVVPCDCDTDLLKVSNQTEYDWVGAMQGAEIIYKSLLSDGWSPQQARSVLPNSLKTEIVVTANLREWMHIFEQRTSKAAHPQMRELMVPLLADFRESIPVIFNEIGDDAS